MIRDDYLHKHTQILRVIAVSISKQILQSVFLALQQQPPGKEDSIFSGIVWVTIVTLLKIKPDYKCSKLNFTE